MKKFKLRDCILIGFCSIILSLVSCPGISQTINRGIIGGTSNIISSSDCSWLTWYGTLCHDTDDGKLYKWNGATQVELAAGGAGDVATDAIWDAAGDLAVGTGANTAAKLTKGAQYSVLQAGASTLGFTTATYPATVTTGGIVYATGTNAIGELADVAAGQPLLSGGVATVPTYAGYQFSGTAAQTYTFPSATSTLQSTTGSPADFVIASQATGDMLYASSATTWARATAGTQNYVWTMGASIPGWNGTLNVSTVNLPSSDADPGTTAGQIRHDSTNTDASGGGSVKWFDATNVRTLVDAGTTYTYLIKTEYIPVAYMEDGAAPPAASSVLASTRKVRIRAFDGASNENLEIMWVVPDDYVGGIKFRFVGYVSSATAPANTEIVAFSLAGCSLANSEVLGCTAGTAQTSSLTADATYVQYDRLAGAYSSAITVTGIAAGENTHFIFERLATTTDTYAQDFGLAGIEIKYQAKVMLNSTY